MAKDKEAKKETPATEKDDSILGSLCELGNSLGDMILSPLEDAVKELAKSGKDEPEVKSTSVTTAKEKFADGTDKHNISINLGGFFQADKPDKRTAPLAKKKGKAPGEQEPADESDDSAE